jgi:flagellar motor switch protein FliN
MDLPENNVEEQQTSDATSNAGDGASAAPAKVSDASFAFNDLPQDHSGGNKPANLDLLLDIPLEISVELGRTKMMIHDLLKLGQGSVIELGKPAGDTLEILANNRLIAKGDVVVMNDKYGIRLTEVISTVERLEKLK